MFTGLIRHLGTLESRSSRPGGARLRIAAPADLLARAELGASIAVNGACLTSVAMDGRAFEADLSEETLAKTTLGRLSLGSVLHLEPALRVGAKTVRAAGDQTSSPESPGACYGTDELPAI